MKKAFSVLAVLFISFQLNAQWVQTNGPYGTITCLLEDGENIYAATNIGVCLTTDNGANWKQKNNGLTDANVTSLAIIDTNIFAGTADSGIYCSTNNGTNWTKENNGMTDTIVVSLAVSGKNILARTGKGIFLSTNNGTNWTQLNNDYKGYVTSLAANGNNIYVGTIYGPDAGVFLSTNNGINWKKVSNDLPSNLYILSLVVSNNNIYVATDEGGVFLSTNNGTNWTKVVNGTLGDCTSLAVSGTNIFAGTNGEGVFLATNNVTNWTKINNGMTDTIIVSLAVIGSNVFAGTRGDGVWRRSLSELTGVANEVNVLPKEYALYQNYPNPFNPSTVIKYVVPFESNVNIRFYNSLGQIVREINEGTRQPGNHEINFSSSGLASGIYFYSIKAISADGKNDFSVVKKMILLK